MKRLLAAGIVALFIVAGASQAMAGGGVMIPDPNSGELVNVGDQNDDPPGEPASEPEGPFGSRLSRATAFLTAAASNHPTDRTIPDGRPLPLT